MAIAVVDRAAQFSPFYDKDGVLPGATDNRKFWQRCGRETISP